MSMTGSWSERISVSTMSALERAEMTLEAMMIERVWNCLPDERTGIATASLHEIQQAECHVCQPGWCSMNPGGQLLDFSAKHGHSSD